MVLGDVLLCHESSGDLSYFSVFQSYRQRLAEHTLGLEDAVRVVPQSPMAKVTVQFLGRIKPVVQRLVLFGRTPEAPRGANRVMI